MLQMGELLGCHLFFHYSFLVHHMYQFRKDSNKLFILVVSIQVLK